ncbi:MAG: glycosyltransferase family 2 protein [Nitrososphaerales archaeon]
MTAAVILCIISPKTFVTSLFYGVSAVYIIWGVYHVIITGAGLKPPLNPSISLKEYPKISAIIPARNEPILGRTIEICVEHILYPKEKKEVIVVTDDPEGERIALWYQLKYPSIVKVLARKQFYPTKPSALNDALALCTGEIVAILDVEDIPDRDVFLKAASAIMNHGCQAVQVILRISNENDSLLTKLFAVEFAAWFRIWLNGRARLKLYAPLGGTGNYFTIKALKNVGGWDSTNLAEDAEVAIRLLIASWNIEVLDARHSEEAPVSFEPWLRQRTRWFRGWLQSLWKYLLALFSPAAIKRLGFVRIFTVLLMLLNPLIVIMNWVAYALTIYWVMEASRLLPFGIMTEAGPVWIYIPATLNALYYYVWFKGAQLEGISLDRRYALHIIYYLNIMMPLAALRAFYQEIFKPVFWEKTKHIGRGVRWVGTEKIEYEH